MMVLELCKKENQTTCSPRDHIAKDRTKCLVLTSDEMLSSEVYVFFGNINTLVENWGLLHVVGGVLVSWQSEVS